MIDLTQGKPQRILWKYILPLFGSIIFQQLYNIADSIIAGKFIGENALAAVGSSYELTTVYLSFAVGCNLGASVVVARLFGAKRLTDMKTAINTSYIITGAICITLMLLGFIGMSPLLKLLNTPTEIFEDTLSYINIYTGGLAFLFLYNLTTGIFAALGDSKTPFIFLVVSSLSNIVLDILFVVVFKLGVKGVAWATFLCQGISCVLSMLVLLRQLRRVKCEEKPKIIAPSVIKDFFKISIPTTLQQCCISIGNIAIQGVINSFGSQVIAGYSAAIKYNMFCVLTLVTLSNGLSNFTAQNLGAGNVQRVKEGFLSGLKIGITIAISFSIIYFFAGKDIIKLFLNSDSPEAIAVGGEFLRLVSPFYAIVVLKIVSDGVIRGSGSMVEFFIATFVDLILRVTFTFILYRKLGTLGVWISWPIGWIAGTASALAFYFGGRWKKSVNKTI